MTAIASSDFMSVLYRRKQRMFSAPDSRLPLDDALLDRLDGHALGAQELDCRIYLVFLARQQDGHDPDLMLHAGLADVEADVGELARHLPDDWLFNLGAGGECEPAAAGELAHP